MRCKFASNAKPTFHLFSNPKPSMIKTHHFPESISFTCHEVSKSRLTVLLATRSRHPPPPRAGIRALHSSESLYELLGIGGSEATLGDIKKAYKKMARKYHPDVAPPERVEEHTRRFIMVKEAYETLSNPHKRALYDSDLALGFSFSPTTTTTTTTSEPSKYHQVIYILFIIFLFIYILFQFFYIF